MTVPPLTQASRLAMMLEILSASGGQADASDHHWNWINAFCGEHEGLSPDTFNLAHDMKLTSVSHDSNTDMSIVYLLDAGRDWLKAHRLVHSQPASEGLREVYPGLPMSDADLAKHYEASKHDAVGLVGSEVRQLIGELRYWRKLAAGVEQEVSGTAAGLARELRRTYVTSNGNWQAVAAAALQPLTEPQRLGQEGEMPILMADNRPMKHPIKVKAASTPAQAEPVALDELARGKDELRRLMDVIWRSEFRTEAPNWKPLDDLPGMVSQIDNMYAGVSAQRDQARWDLNNPSTPEQVEPVAYRVEELPMVAFSDRLPVRDEFNGEQTILTYNENVGVYDLEFFGSGDDFPDRWLGDTHWLDITAMWPGVTAQVTEWRAGNAEAAHPPAPPQGREAVVERMAEAIEAARCPNREGPFGGYDYGYPDNKPIEGGRFVIRDFRDPNSPDWGKWLHQTDDKDEHETMFRRMTQHHVAQAALDAALPLLAEERGERS